MPRSGSLPAGGTVGRRGLSNAPLGSV